MQQHEEAVWDFFTQQVVPVIHRYQAESSTEGNDEMDGGGITTVDFEEKLLLAVREEPPSVVSVDDIAC